jgi:hypothetical protein
MEGKAYDATSNRGLRLRKGYWWIGYAAGVAGRKER